MKPSDGRDRLLGCLELDEGEPAGAARLTIERDEDTSHRPGLGEVRPEFVFGGFVRKISYEQAIRHRLESALCRGTQPVERIG
jgi:hypothetical protein